MENYVRNLNKCVIFKATGHLLLRVNVDGVRQASPYVKVNFGLRNIV